MCAHSGRFSLVWWLTPAGKHGAIFLTKIKCLLLRKSQTQQCISFYETLLMPITMWAFQLPKPLKYLKSGNANKPILEMLIYILAAM